jgi:hypothetical protein
MGGAHDRARGDRRTKEQRVTIDFAMSIVALGLAIYAGWQILPRPLVLPWDELFRVTLDASIAGAPPSGADPSIDPRTGLGFDWAALVAWSPEARAALARRLGSIVWVTTGTDLAVAEALGAPAVRLEGLDAGASKALLERLSPELAEPHQRLVFVVGRGEAPALLRVLRAEEVLRDHTRAVVLVDPDLDAEEPWIAEHFHHDALDTELNIPISYIVVNAAPGPGLPERPVPRSGSRALDVVNLSPVNGLGPRPHLERALLVLLAQKSRGW